MGGKLRDVVIFSSAVFLSFGNNQFDNNSRVLVEDGNTLSKEETWHHTNMEPKEGLNIKAQGLVGWNVSSIH